MKKFALLTVVFGSLVAAEVAEAGVFRRGGCPGGVCGVSGGSLAATTPAAPPAVAAAPTPPPAATEGEATVAAPATEQAAPSTAGRFSRLRGIGRRR